MQSIWLFFIYWNIYLSFHVSRSYVFRWWHLFIMEIFKLHSTASTFIAFWLWLRDSRLTWCNFCCIRVWLHYPRYDTVPEESHDALSCRLLKPARNRIWIDRTFHRILRHDLSSYFKKIIVRYLGPFYWYYTVYETYITSHTGKKHSFVEHTV